MVKQALILILCRLLTSLTYGQVTDSTNILITFVEEAPYFNGNLVEYIQNEIDYPKFAKKDSIEGTVYISFLIDTLGNTYDHKIIRGVRDDLNNEAMRVANLILFEKPAMQKGRPIEVQYTVAIIFYLNNTEKKMKCRRK